MEIEAHAHPWGVRVHEPAVRHRISEAASEQARALFTDGIRKVVFTEPVDLADPRSRRSLDLMRELAAWGMRVEWRAVEIPAEWRSFGHLPPPAGSTPELDVWRRSFHPGKCALRQGPGFIQIRDRRSGVLDCYTIDEPGLQGVVRHLAGGAEPDRCDPEAIELLIEHDLLVRAGDLTWWAPARVRRWPVPAMTV